MEFAKQKRSSAVVSLALDGSRIDGVVLRRVDGALQLERSFSFSLTLDPLTADPALVGRELRNHLDAAGVRERCCVVGLPLKWALTAHAELPELAAEDLGSFLQIQAERGFPSDVETLQYCSSITDPKAAAGGVQDSAAAKATVSTGKRQAFLAGMPKNHLRQIEAALREAKLKPLSFSLGITALQPPGSPGEEGVLALVIGESHVALQITCAGGVAALRALEGVLEAEGGRRLLHAELIAREARITLGQLAPELREMIRRIRIFGPRDLAQQLADEMELRLEQMAMEVEVVAGYPSGEFGLQVPADAPVSVAFSLAARYLAMGKPWDPLESTCRHASLSIL